MKRVNLMISAPVESHDSIEAMEKYLREELSDVEGLEVTVTVSTESPKPWRLSPSVESLFLAALREPGGTPGIAGSKVMEEILGTETADKRAAVYIACEIASAMISYEARPQFWGHQQKGVTV